MQLAPLRFTKIDGTAVVVDVASAEEAKEALKELKHKKRELKFLRGALVKQRKEMRARRPQPKRKSKKAPREKEGFELLLDDLRWGLSSLVGNDPAAASKPSASDIDTQVRRIDETLHNLQGCILQIEGKLLTRRR